MFWEPGVLQWKANNISITCFHSGRVRRWVSNSRLCSSLHIKNSLIKICLPCRRARLHDVAGGHSGDVVHDSENVCGLADVVVDVLVGALVGDLRQPRLLRWKCFVLKKKNLLWVCGQCHKTFWRKSWQGYQCDQIGLFWKVIATNYLINVTKIFGDYLGYLAKHPFLVINWCGYFLCNIG